MHVFGDHKNCAEYFCVMKNSGENNFIPDLNRSGLLPKIMQIFNSLADNAKSLLYDASSNSAENFNSVVAKFIGGKRVNYCFRGSYQARCNAATVARNSLTPRYRVHKTLYNCSPGKYTKLLNKRLTKLREYVKMNKKIRTPKKLFPIRFSSALIRPLVEKSCNLLKSAHFASLIDICCEHAQVV